MKKIIDCEHAYSKEYCSAYEDDNVIRFSDDSLSEMRDHNYTYIKNKKLLKELIEAEIYLASTRKKGFLKIVLDIDSDDFSFPDLGRKYSLDEIGYYLFDVSKFAYIKSEKDVLVKKLNKAKMIDDIIFCDLEFDEDLSRKNFHEKKNKRRGEVYLADNHLNAYICYEDDKPIGICDLYICDEVAKIENFLIIPKCQRKGYGTYLLKKMIEIALEDGAKLIYLITDEGDTAKEMYEKLYFTKVGRMLELVFDLTSEK